DQAVIATLEAEAARLRGELDEVESEAARLVPDGERLQEAEAVLAAEKAEYEGRWGDHQPVAAEVRGELALQVAHVANDVGELLVGQRRRPERGHLSGPGPHRVGDLLRGRPVQVR